MIEVILLLALCALRFLKMSSFIDLFSKKSNVCKTKISKIFCKLNETIVSPRIIPTSINRNTLNNRLKFVLRIARGRKKKIITPYNVAKLPNRMKGTLC